MPNALGLQPSFPYLVYLTKQNELLAYSDTHREIVEACKSGDRSAQFELYQLYSKAMYNICLRMLKTEADAEDVLQNAFIDVFGKLDSFRFESTIGAWIKRIVINNCINFLKKRRLYFEEISDRLTEMPDDDSNRYSDQLSVAKIKHAVNELPDGYRVVFSLYAFEGYDHGEIAQILDISESTSKSQYSRARKKLRELLLNNRTLTSGYH